MGDRLTRRCVLVALCGMMVVGTALGAWAHCDRINGPVAQDAISALDRGDFSIVQIWVGQDEEGELRQRFDEALTVRQQGGVAKEMADRYFIETAIRLHREAEGMPYTGVKPAGEPAPDIVAAERALETGDQTIVTDYLDRQIEEEVGKWYVKAREARANKGASVEAGREWVDAYVKYVVFVHTLAGAIEAGPPHGVGGH